MSHASSSGENDPSSSTEPSLSVNPQLAEVPSSQSDADLLQALLHERHLLQSQVNSQTHFIHLLLHQLATPLTSLQGSVQLLGEPLLEAEQRQEFLELAQQQVQHLQTLLQSLVALRSVEVGVLESQPTSFSLRSLVEEVVGLFHSTSTSYQFHSDLPEIWGDRWQISQVLMNLVSNAVKYSTSQDVVEIGANCPSKGWVEVWVRDRGLGIPIEAQPHLFERFYRVRHADRANISGTGLGLSLCKLLIENQGGQIGFESTHGEGSRFFFTLPTVQ